MFGKEKIRQLETRLSDALQEAKKNLKEKTDLAEQLKQANARVKELEKRLEDNELETLKAQAKQTIVEYEGLKELYNEKIRKFEDSKTAAEENFAKEAANKRQDLSEEIRENRESNRNMVSETITTFAGSYSYYLDQIRALMDALSLAAKETGETLFNPGERSIKERFAAAIVEQLRSDKDALKQNSGDVLLIGAEEIPEDTETEAAQEPPEEAEDLPEITGETDENPYEAVAEENAPEIAGETSEKSETMMGAVEETP